MNILIRLITSFGLFLITGYIVMYAVLTQFDGDVFELPNYIVLIHDNSFHIYNKRIPVELKLEETE